MYTINLLVIYVILFSACIVLLIIILVLHFITLIN